MKNAFLILGSSLLLASCGGLTWADYKKTCIDTSIFLTKEQANTKCDCEIEKYKANGLEPGDMADIEKTNSVDVIDCQVIE